MKRFDSRVAVVTGAGGGIGAAISRRLAAEGASVALWDRDLSAAQAAAADLGSRVVAIEVDISSVASVEAAVAQTCEELGATIDVLVNNAGIVDVALPWEVTQQSWADHFAVNATGTFNCVQAVLPAMQEKKYGKIVNIGSLAGQQGRPGTSTAYSASKGAVLGMTVSLAHNLGPFGICVNAVNPGFIKTDIFRDWTPEQLARTMAGVPLRKHGDPDSYGEPDDIAGAVAYLASSDADYVTGAFLNVNGGVRTGA